MDPNKKTKWARRIGQGRVDMGTGSALKQVFIQPVKTILTIMLGGGLGIDLFIRYQEVRYPILLFLLGLFLVSADRITDWLTGKWYNKSDFRKVEEEYVTKTLNPHLNEISNDIEKIKRRLGIDVVDILENNKKL